MALPPVPFRHLANAAESRVSKEPKKRSIATSFFSPGRQRGPVSSGSVGPPKILDRPWQSCVVVAVNWTTTDRLGYCWRARSNRCNRQGLAGYKRSFSVRFSGHFRLVRVVSAAEYWPHSILTVGKLERRVFSDSHRWPLGHCCGRSQGCLPTGLTRDQQTISRRPVSPQHPTAISPIPRANDGRDQLLVVHACP